VVVEVGQVAVTSVTVRLLLGVTGWKMWNDKAYMHSTTPQH
jgi:hypothetical protein